MSRFPEMQRIERAIRSREPHQLRWAETYCQSRLGLDKDPEQLAQWHALLQRVRDAIAGRPAS